MISDFYEILAPEEREGRGHFDQQGADEYGSTIRGLIELEADGGIFTLTNGVGPAHTRSKLDRMFGY